MKKKLIFLDLDGTLWDQNGIPESAKEAIARARNNGHKVFANTGRTMCEASQELYSIDLDGYVFSAGSHIILDGKDLAYHPLSKKQVNALQEFFTQKQVAFSLEGKERTFMNEANRVFFAQQEEGNRIGMGTFPDLDEMTEEDIAQIMKASVHSKETLDLTPITDDPNLSLTFTPFTIMAVPDLFIGEFTDPTYDKGTAMHILKNHFNNEYETMAFGDSENDLPMLKAADHAVVMGNGNEAVKSIADHITTAIDQDGLYNAFKYYSLI